MHLSLLKPYLGQAPDADKLSKDHPEIPLKHIVASIVQGNEYDLAKPIILDKNLRQ